MFLECIHLLFLLLKLQQPQFHAKRKYRPTTEEKGTPVKRQRKPEWVKQEIIRLKAFMMHDGCRKIADTFNRLHSEKRDMVVSKSYVATIIQKHHNDIRILRKQIRNVAPKLLPKNQVWSMDLTQVNDIENVPHRVFGIVDSGTRFCLHLNEIYSKSSVNLLCCLLDTMGKHGKPNTIKTDNEPVFTSRLFRLGLWLLNIKHQRSEVCCP